MSSMNLRAGRLRWWCAVLVVALIVLATVQGELEGVSRNDQYVFDYWQVKPDAITTRQPNSDFTALNGDNYRGSLRIKCPNSLVARAVTIYDRYGNTKLSKRDFKELFVQAREYFRFTAAFIANCDIKFTVVSCNTHCPVELAGWWKSVHCQFDKNPPVPIKCIRCEAGWWCDRRHRYKCEAGTFSGNTASKCTDCPVGEYQPNKASKNCIKCPFGTAQGLTGQPTCLQCSPGFFQNMTGQASCMPCPVGTYQPEAGQMKCLDCGANDYEGGSACTACPIGYSCEDGVSRKCRLGHFCVDSEEEPCPGGQFQGSEGQLSCQIVPPGHYTQASGTAFPIPCPAGTFSSDHGATECQQCAANMVTLVDGLSECMLCPAGTFRQDASTCALCPHGTTTLDEGSVSANDCIVVEDLFGEIWNSTALQCNKASGVPAFVNWIQANHANIGEDELRMQLRAVLDCTAIFLESVRDRRAIWDVRFRPDYALSSATLFQRSIADAEVNALRLQLKSAWLEFLPKRFCPPDGIISFTWNGESPVSICQISAQAVNDDGVFDLALSAGWISRGGVKQENKDLVKEGGCTDLEQGDSASVVFVRKRNANIAKVDVRFGGSIDLTQVPETIKVDLWNSAILKTSRQDLSVTYHVSEVADGFECASPPNQARSIAMPPLPQYVGDSFTPVLDISTYRTLNSTGLFSFCAKAIASLDCPPSTFRESPMTACKFSPVKWPTQLVMTGFCSTLQDITGSPLSVALLAFAFAGARIRATTAAGPRAAMRVLESLYDAAVHGMRSSEPPSAAFRDLAGLIGRELEQISAIVNNLDRLDVYSFHDMGSLCRSEGCEANPEKAGDNLRDLENKFLLDKLLGEFGKVVYDSWNSLRGLIQEGFEGQKVLISNLAELVVSTSIEMSEANAEALAQAAGGLMSEAQNRLNVAEYELHEYENTIEEILISTLDEAAIVKEIVALLDSTFKRLDGEAKEFYDSREEFELAELARKRANAIKDILVGGISMVGEIAAAVGTGGASTAAKIPAASTTRRVQASNEISSNFKDSPKRLDSVDLSGLSYGEAFMTAFGNDLPATISDFKDSIASAFKDDGSIDFSVETGLELARGTLAFYQGNMEFLSDVGVPGAEGAAQMYGGMLTLIDSARAEADIGNRHDAGIEQADMLFDATAAVMQKVAKAFSLMQVELKQVAVSREPPAGPSFAASTSDTLWEECRMTLFRYLESSLLRKDLEDFVNMPPPSRLLTDSEPLAVPQFDSRAAKDSAVRGRLVQRGGSLVDGVDAPVAGASEFSRALASKNDVEENYEETLVHAKAALSTISEIKEILDRVVLFGEAMQAGITELVRAVRQARVIRAKIAAEEKIIEEWLGIQTAILQANTTEKLSNLGDAFQRELAILVLSMGGKLQVPGLPDVLSFVEEGLGLRDTEGLVRGAIESACNQAFYYSLQETESCIRDMSTLSVTDTSDGENKFGHFLDMVSAALIKAASVANGSAEWHIRIPLLSAMDVVAQASANATGQDINEDTIIEVNATHVNCGPNAELENLVIVLERKTDENPFGFVPVPLPRWASSPDTPTVLKLKPVGASIKYDSQGGRHAFMVMPDIDIFAEAVVLSSECNANHHISTALPGGFFLCTPANKAPLVEPIPLNSRFRLTLGEYAELLLAERSSDELGLTMYAKIKLADGVRPAAACRIPEITNPPPTFAPTFAPTRTAPVEDAQDTFPIIPVVAGAGGVLVFVLVVARANSRKKQDDNASTSQGEVQVATAYEPEVAEAVSPIPERKANA